MRITSGEQEEDLVEGGRGSVVYCAFALSYSSRKKDLPLLLTDLPASQECSVARLRGALRAMFQDSCFPLACVFFRLLRILALSLNDMFPHRPCCASLFCLVLSSGGPAFSHSLCTAFAKSLQRATVVQPS